MLPSVTVGGGRVELDAPASPTRHFSIRRILRPLPPIGLGRLAAFFPQLPNPDRVGDSSVRSG
jgi:hypothetical protein